MIVIRDRRKRLWARRLDVAAAIRMREIAGLDVMACAVREGDNPLAEMETVVNALYAVFLPDMGPIRSRTFGRRLRTIPADELQVALVEGISEFVRAPRPPSDEPGEDNADLSAAELWCELWRLAGICGVDPAGFTLGELVTMAEGRRRDEWARTAHVIATVANSAPGRKGQAVDPADMDPTGGIAEQRRRNGRSDELTPDNLASVASILVGR